MGYGVDFSKKDFSDEDYERIIKVTTKIINENKEEQEEIGTAYYNRGLVYYSKHEEDKAIPDFTNAIELMPDFANAYYMRAASYYMFYENEKALIDAQKAFQLDETDLKCAEFIEELKDLIKHNHQSVRPCHVL